MPVREPTDAELYTLARDTLALLDMGIPWEAVVVMSARVRQAYVTALHDMTVDREMAEDLEAVVVGGSVN